MQDKAERNRIAVNIWTARIIPIVLAGVVGYATYVLVALLCVNYVLAKHNDQAAAIIILVIYFFLFILMTASFLRLIHITVCDPPYLALGKAAKHDRNIPGEREKVRQDANSIATAEYNRGHSSEETSTESASPQNDLDSPGLELFYTKDVFTCEMDGKPRWCSQCSNWKPDRTHHCSSSGRCILKMDHFCPWVGGPIGENNFKFFVQFTGYTALFCLHLLVVMAVYVHKQVANKEEDANRHFWAILGLAAFFGLFTAGMTATSLGLAMRNLTQVEKLGSKTRVSILAVLKPSPDQLSRVTPTLPLLTYPEITYPLAAPQRKPSGQQPPDGGASQMSLSAQPQSTLIMPTKLSNSEAFNSPSSHLDIEGVDGAPETQPIAAAQLLPVDSSVNEKPREVLSARDLKASKTFAVLRMPQGDNPWDLGSWLLNLQTLMGTNIFDWLLPVKRSPCTKHEHQESHYAIGPSVDMLKATVSFINAEDIRGSRGGMPKQNSYRDHQGLSQRQGEARRRKRRKHSSARRAGTQEPSLPYDISEVTNHAVQMDDLSNNERYT